MPTAAAQDVYLFGLLALFSASGVVTVVALLKGRASPRTLLRSLATGLFIGTVVGGVTGAAAYLLLDGAWSQGILVGLAVGAGYVCLGLLLAAGGLLLGASAGWTTRGAWLTAPVAALVFVSAAGLTLGTAQRAAGPTLIARPGQAEVELFTGAADTSAGLSASGPAQCEASSTGSFEVTAGQDGVPPLSAADGTPITFQLRLSDDGVTLFALTAGAQGAWSGRGWDIDDAIELSAGASRRAGELRFAGLLPFEGADGEAPIAGAAWRGALRWTCAD